jgi:hypothetical protein
MLLMRTATTIFGIDERDGLLERLIFVCICLLASVKAAAIRASGRICVRHRKMPRFRIKGAACLLDVSDDTLRRRTDGAANVSAEIPRPTGKIVRAISPLGGQSSRHRPGVLAAPGP